MAEKPRILQSRRDMVLTMVPLIALCLLAVFASGNFRFGFGADPKDETVPAINPKSVYEISANNLGFGVRMPAGEGVVDGVPADWKATATSDEDLSGGTLFSVNYVTPEANSLRFAQTDAPESQALGSVYGSSRAKASGSVPVGGRTWAVYGPNDKGFSAWTLKLDGTLLVLFGGATVPRFTEFAGLVQDQAPLPKT